MHCRLVPTAGGTERTTLLLAEALHKRHDCECVLVALQEGSEKFDCFSAQYDLIHQKSSRDKISFLHEIIAKYQIDICLIESAFELPYLLNKARQQARRPISILFVHHFAPGWERTVFPMTTYKKLKKSSGLIRFRYRMKLRIFPLFAWNDIRKMKAKYKQAYLNSDKIVLLSKQYIPSFVYLAGAKKLDKFTYIPNALSFDEFFDMSCYDEKQKIVVIVSRLEERQKRILLALRLWKKIKQYAEAKDWKLFILGEGPHATDLAWYCNYVQSNQIPNVEFLGRVNSLPYYTNASIYMMTSSSEGLPMTLNEAHQNGVVPVVFNTFDALQDQVTDGHDGYVVEEGDTQRYIECVLRLMSDNKLRRTMAANGISSSKQFTMDNIMERWLSLIDAQASL